MIFLLLNTVLLFGSIFIAFKAFLNHELFMQLPFVFQLLIGIGLITPLANIYDGIKNFVMIKMFLEHLDKEEK